MLTVTSIVTLTLAGTVTVTRWYHTRRLIHCDHY
jgi:hypothetical protein